MIDAIFAHGVFPGVATLFLLACFAFWPAYFIGAVLWEWRVPLWYLVIRNLR